jgi:hypothetical protein
MDLEQITKAAGAYAMNCWWQAHDEKNWEKVKDHVAISERVLERYTGKTIDSAGFNAAVESFVQALKAYDNYAAMLKDEEMSTGTIQDYLSSYYVTLIGPDCPKDLAKATTDWWTNYAKSMIRLKNNDLAGYNLYDGFVHQYLTKEHVLRFKLDENTANGLTNLMLSAAHLGHNKKDYAKAEQLMKVYATELFSALSKQN